MILLENMNLLNLFDLTEQWRNVETYFVVCIYNNIILITPCYRSNSQEFRSIMLVRYSPATKFLLRMDGCLDNINGEMRNILE